jgi:hypothetical protein
MTISIEITENKKENTMDVKIDGLETATQNEIYYAMAMIEDAVAEK